MIGKKPYMKWTILLMLLFATAGCSTISTFDQYAYVQATGLKVDALAIMDLAVDSAAHHTAEIRDITLRIDKAYEYEKLRPKNDISAEMWGILKSPDRNLFGGFLKRWEEKQVLRAAYIEDKKEQIAKAFDIIAELESSKLKPEEAQSLFSQP